jgi:anaerobic magnesium-protoporphyrin IX monomethyl ester cyclase
MKILLVVYDNNSYIHWFPQGLGYIAAALRSHNHEVQVYSQDRDHYPDEHLTHFLDNNHFDIIGISIIAGYFQYRKLLRLSQAINNSRDRPFFIIGGHGPSPEPSYFLKKTNADAVVIGEGEETVIELVESIGDIQALSQIKGIAYRRRRSGGQRKATFSRRY